MKFLRENKIIFHPGKIQPDGTFVDPDGNPYDLIPCDPTKLVKKSSKMASSGSEEADDSKFEPDKESEEDEWIDLDTFDPYEGIDEEDIDFAPDEIKKDTVIDLGDSEDEIDDEDDSTDTDKSKKETDDKSKDKPKTKPIEFPDDSSIRPIEDSPEEDSKVVSGKLVDPHTFVTADGRTIKL